MDWQKQSHLPYQLQSVFRCEFRDPVHIKSLPVPVGKLREFLEIERPTALRQLGHLCEELLEAGRGDDLDESGWLVFGGTSVSSPIIVSVYALAGNAGSVTSGSYPYSHRTGLFDVTSGSNGSCGGSYLCMAKVGYDGPTGLGTPKGTSSF